LSSTKNHRSISIMTGRLQYIPETDLNGLAFFSESGFLIKTRKKL
jgi:hypothetical protein